ncbi:unnamed protein product [Phytomonas sp. Hart1]|nr:unnamed protein product [Phytomonas sp. Hart1]|eukprot:CCW69000.1 unnamed protein product [Phytomonas sp. isolate Hart1]
MSSEKTNSMAIVFTEILVAIHIVLVGVLLVYLCLQSRRKVGPLMLSTQEKLIARKKTQKND